MVCKDGLFITFEGGECSGKSTQSLMLYEALVSSGIECVLTKEPGGTDSAEQIRNLLLNPLMKLMPASQLLLHVAARVEHLQDVILPALKAGKVVICDRFSDSTVAYQHYGCGISMSVLSWLHETFVDNIEPDITFVMNIGFDTFKKRMKIKQAALAHADRYESMPDSFHKKVLLGFKKIVQQNRKRCVLIDAGRHGLKEVHKRVLYPKHFKFLGREPSGFSLSRVL